MPDKSNKRKGLSASIRWSVFARDGFTCRYCGKQAGQDGVDLACDHVISVADGGDNRIDNLVTACRTCNAGKGAKSLKAVPVPEEVVKRVEAGNKRLYDLAEQLRESQRVHDELDQQIVNMICKATGDKTTGVPKKDFSGIASLCTEFGYEDVSSWIASSHRRGVPDNHVIRYLRGCARNRRNELEKQDDYYKYNVGTYAYDGRIPSQNPWHSIVVMCVDSFPSLVIRWIQSSDPIPPINKTYRDDWLVRDVNKLHDKHRHVDECVPVGHEWLIPHPNLETAAQRLCQIAVLCEMYHCGTVAEWVEYAMDLEEDPQSIVEVVCECAEIMHARNTAMKKDESNG